MPPPNCKIHGKNFEELLKRCFPHGWASKKNLISKTFKAPVSSFCEYIFLQKINVGRKNTSSQWLICFRKIQPFKSFLQAEKKL